MGLVGPWLSLWVLPKNQQSFDIPKLFDAQKVTKYRKDKGFKCSASEMLTLYKFLQYFLEVMYMSNSCMVKECRSFIAVSTFGLSTELERTLFGQPLPQDFVGPC